MPSLWYVNLTLDEATNERVSYYRIVTQLVPLARRPYVAFAVKNIMS